jgi:hypothetical protein
MTYPAPSHRIFRTFSGFVSIDQLAVSCKQRGKVVRLLGRVGLHGPPKPSHTILRFPANPTFVAKKHRRVRIELEEKKIAMSRLIRNRPEPKNVTDELVLRTWSLKQGAQSPK